MPSRADDWMRQAERDLQHARHAMDAAEYEWACFAAQQAAEKAVKAVYLSRHLDPWGNSVLALLRNLPASHAASAALLDGARELDRSYIPARYPNSHPQGAPFEYFTAADAERAIGHAEGILRFCAGLLAEPSQGD